MDVIDSIPIIADMHARVAWRLRRAREIRGLSQSAVAQMAGYTTNGPVARMESYVTSPTLAVITRIAFALDLTLEELVSETDPEWAQERKDSGRRGSSRRTRGVIRSSVRRR